MKETGYSLFKLLRGAAYMVGLDLKVAKKSKYSNRAANYWYIGIDHVKAKIYDFLTCALLSHHCTKHPYTNHLNLYTIILILQQPLDLSH